MSRPLTSVRYSAMAWRPRSTRGLLGGLVRSTIRISALSSYRSSSALVSRSSMPRRNASTANVVSVVYPTGYPDFPMPQQLRSDRSGGSVAISCLVSDLTFEWRLHPLDEGRATEIVVHVGIPESEGHRLAGQQGLIHRSLLALAHLAAESGRT